MSRFTARVLPFAPVFNTAVSAVVMVVLGLAVVLSVFLNAADILAGWLDTTGAAPTKRH